MSKKPDYLVQVMEKIGSPLIASVNDVSARLQASGQAQNDDPAAQISEDATKIATLLNKSVQVAISMSNMLDISQDDSEADSVRLALTALAGPMLANQYRMSTRLPGDNDVKRIVTALEAVMTFSDNFTVAGDASARLDQIDKDFFPTDPTQIQIMYIQALVPTVNAVVAFPFGQPERKLIQEIADRLIKKAQSIREESVPSASGGMAKKCELAILRSLSVIYSQCHFGEMARLMGLPADQREQQQTSMEPVWKAFEARADLLDVLAEQALPSDGEAVQKTGSAGGGAVPPKKEDQPAQPAQPMQQTPPAQPVQQQTQPPPSTQQPPPPARETAQEATQAQPATQQPPAQQQQTPVQQQQTPVQQPPQQEQQQTSIPKASPPPQETHQPPTPSEPGQQPAQSAPADETVDNSGQSENQDTSDDNPMSFFKQPASSSDTQGQ